MVPRILDRLIGIPCRHAVAFVTAQVWCVPSYHLVGRGHSTTWHNSSLDISLLEHPEGYTTVSQAAGLHGRSPAHILAVLSLPPASWVNFDIKSSTLTLRTTFDAYPRKIAGERE